MRFPTVVVALISLLCVNVQADKDAIGDEVLFFYYVYKMEFQATGNSGMGGNRCRGKLIKAPCGFSDFVKDVMAKRFRDAYRPASADLTHKPDASNLRQFEAVDTRIPRQYLLNKVIRGQVKRIPNARQLHPSFYMTPPSWRFLTGHQIFGYSTDIESRADPTSVDNCSARQEYRESN